MTHALLTVALVIGVVFAHGGACAAVELAESSAHGAHLTGRTAEQAALLPSGHAAERAAQPLDGPAAEPADRHGLCLHSGLPERHRHGTEQDCSASPAGSTSYLALSGGPAVPSAHPGVEPVQSPAADVSPAAPRLSDLGVMRV